ncbi:Cell wall assembly regulator SMI1 [Paractinoplanes atraurantiacus]|uniref:Cell wall assembly regulator SMI1 n=1 Tax=Paractinoplanes atraurantiacus TaxID=1036182 RepID=A0A285J249_9ACTN|nr:Cell wall assembly regulator SMI1 [Actinoplanes atraurantiacus]
MGASADVEWRAAVGALASAAEVPVGLVSVGAVVDDDDPARGHLAGVLELPEVSRLGLEQARDLVVALRQAHGLVLVVAPEGLLVPLGADGWTLADLAEAVRAPAVVVSGGGPDAVNRTTLMLGALAGHGIAAAVVTVGDVDEQMLPVRPAGRLGDEQWLDDMLVARAAVTPAVLYTKPAVSGQRIVLALVAVFAFMVLLVCGIAWFGRSTAELSITRDAAPVPVPRRTPQSICPENAGPVTVTRPDAATTARVDKAWQRIEAWLAAHAPVSAGTLGRPAPHDRIDALQRRMSVAFPADLVASLRRHDGLSAAFGFDLPPFYMPAALNGILAEWQANCRTSGAWDKGLVPFARTLDGGCLLVDQRPGGHGRVGEYFPEDGVSFERWPASVTEFLEQTAKALETGRPYGGHFRPRVADGTLDWEIV